MSAAIDQLNKEQSNATTYIVFHVGHELYGTPLLEVREVIEFQQPKFVPNMHDSFLGVINLRGSIVGVVDLRKRMGMKSEVHKRSALLVCHTPQGVLGALVDRVDSVIAISNDNIEREAPLKSRIPDTHFNGVAKDASRIITLVDLTALLADGK